MTAPHGITASGVMAALLGVLLIVAAVGHMVGYTVGVGVALAAVALVGLGALARHDSAR